jgi:hypothetical protein
MKLRLKVESAAWNTQVINGNHYTIWGISSTVYESGVIGHRLIRFHRKVAGFSVNGSIEGSYDDGQVKYAVYPVKAAASYTNEGDEKA